ncbi:ABC transporter permease subunit [Acetobacter fallax]|uniref:ABC transporter permease subunit n=1 Tax=Acetobacter fallax TaxID=1737473 RepID=A0ABX0K5R5_9PROT|nr:ABC transporter permease subunit [Acetobacter fallax]NHO31719.1 ABC transporter permease subunit [Acetobacter fallax]NHO35278.1 ABC transporter permease subunit [Acetobacter fallax]
MSASASLSSDRYSADEASLRVGVRRFVGMRALICVLCFEMLAGVAVHLLTGEDTISGRQTVLLSLPGLPDCALHTALRMATVLVLSVMFSVFCAIVTDRRERFRENILSFLDESRAVPVCGFLVFAAPLFSMLVPGHGIAGECLTGAAVFPVLAGPMTAALLRSGGRGSGELDLVARGFRLTGWQRFWRLDMPVAIPVLVKGAVEAMPFAWLALLWVEIFVWQRAAFVAPGLGACVAAAAATGIVWPVVLAALIMMLIVIGYDWLVFRPLLSWSARFQIEGDGAGLSGLPSEPPVLRFLRRAPVVGRLGEAALYAVRRLGTLRLGRAPVAVPSSETAGRPYLAETVALAGLCATTLAVCWQPLIFHIGPDEVVRVAALGFATLLRVLLMVLLASVIWLFPGMWLGRRRAEAAECVSLMRLLAVFPTVMLFPLMAGLITGLRLSSGFWLMPLVMIGPQWFLAAKLTGGVATFPRGLFEAARAYDIRGWLWWRSVVLPGIGRGWLAGARMAFFGAWNLAIAAEFVRWGDVRLISAGLGAYIAEAMEAGDSVRAAFGVTVMTAFAALLSALVWEPLAAWVRRRTMGAE